jgi:hypothetical protein
MAIILAIMRAMNDLATHGIFLAKVAALAARESRTRRAEPLRLPQRGRLVVGHQAVNSSLVDRAYVEAGSHASGGRDGALAEESNFRTLNFRLWAGAKMYPATRSLSQPGRPIGELLHDPIGGHFEIGRTGETGTIAAGKHTQSLSIYPVRVRCILPWGGVTSEASRIA